MSLPGADELFRTTGGMALSPSLARPAEAPRAETARAAEPGTGPGSADAPNQSPGGRLEQPRPAAENAAGVPQQAPGRQPQGPASGEEQTGEAARRARSRSRAARRPTGRERHDEKITVYVSAEELMDLEHARLVLRGEHGLAVDRGRVVREAISVVLADLEQRGEASILVRRLRGR
ncbi:hypothetical protein [Saccharothrix sp. ST-888]|uniref:hypothetical protein n=1 Tax=Saccharothrix sp. ST-888 TaxID=1427391 RepID=UPI0005EC9AFA|nr:hypothetical protein UK12_09220 [Saccharothrix sp. ST-888]